MMGSLGDQAEVFYRRLFDIRNDGTYWERWDANTPLINFFCKHLGVDENKADKKEVLLQILLKKNKEHYQEGTVTDNDRNIRNLFEETQSFKIHWEKDGDKLEARVTDPIEPQRETLLRIAFSLKMKSDKCNEMLAAAGQYALHKGGNARESIYSYCLDEERPASIAVKLYQQYIGLPCTVNTTPDDWHLSQRTQINANKIDIFLKNNKELHTYEKDREFVLFLQTIAHDFTECSGRAWRVFENLRKKITTQTFLDFWGPALNLKDSYIDRKVIYSIHNERSVPTRDYICLLSTAVYFKEKNPAQSLLSYVNTDLTSCGLGPLKENQHPDSLIIELSKYDIDSCKKNKILYKDKNTIEYLDISNVSEKDRFKIAKHILDSYTSGKYFSIQPLRNISLMNARAFFENEKKKTEK